jgi:hypothetical protein
MPKIDFKGKKNHKLENRYSQFISAELNIHVNHIVKQLKSKWHKKLTIQIRFSHSKKFL